MNRREFFKLPVVLFQSGGTLDHRVTSLENGQRFLSERVAKHEIDIWNIKTALRTPQRVPNADPPDKGTA